MKNIKNMVMAIIQVCGDSDGSRLMRDDPRVLIAAVQLEEDGKTSDKVKMFGEWWIRRVKKQTGEEEVDRPTIEDILDAAQWASLKQFERNNTDDTGNFIP